MPPKKKAHKVRHVDEVTAPEHSHRQRQERERSVTPDGLENWLLKMEKLLSALECTDAQKVVYATFALQGPAERWWSGIEQLLRMELEGTLPLLGRSLIGHTSPV
nr:hypothetical protein CFP56_27566 [Quercus suber]